MGILGNINFQKISKGHAKSDTLGGESKTATNAEIPRWLLSSSKSCSWYGCPFQAVCYHFRDQFFIPFHYPSPTTYFECFFHLFSVIVDHAADINTTTWLWTDFAFLSFFQRAMLLVLSSLCEAAICSSLCILIFLGLWVERMRHLSRFLSVDSLFGKSANTLVVLSIPDE